MKKASYIGVIFLIGSMAYASAIVERPNYGKSAIYSSNIIQTNTQEISVMNNETIQVAIKELQKKIQSNPNDYSINVSLVDLYIKSRQYNLSFEELVYLNNLSKRGNLSSEVISEINSLYEYIKKQLNYTQRKAPLYANLAIMALILDDKLKAEKYVDLASTSSVNQSLFLNALSKVYDETQNYQGAILSCDKLLSLKPTNVDVRKIKARYLLLAQKNDDAIEEYTKIVSFNQEDDEAKWELYKLLTMQNKTDKDIISKIYTGVSLEDAYVDLSMMLMKNNNISEAKVYVQKLVEKFPKNADGYLMLAEIYRKEGKLKESYDILAKARDMADSAESVAQYNVILAKLSDEPLKEANSLMANGLYSEALAVLQTANPENLYVILAQARANYFINEKQKSLDYLNKAMTFYPNNSDVYCAFGYIYHKENDIESARKYVEESLKLNPNNLSATQLLKMVNKSDADRYINGIISSFDSQNYDETMRLINEAISISSDYALLHFYKGLTYIAQNNYAASTASLYKSLELDKSNYLTYFYLGFAFDNLSEKTTALEYYQKFVDTVSQDELGESEKLQYAKDRISKLK